MSEKDDIHHLWGWIAVLAFWLGAVALLGGLAIKSIHERIDLEHPPPAQEGE